MYVMYKPREDETPVRIQITKKTWLIDVDGTWWISRMLKLTTGSIWHWVAQELWTVDLPPHWTFQPTATWPFRKRPSEEFCPLPAHSGKVSFNRGHDCHNGSNQRKTKSYSCHSCPFLFQRRCVFINQLPFPSTISPPETLQHPNRLLPKVGPI